MIISGKTKRELASFQLPAVISVICPQAIKSMSAFSEIRQYCNLVQLCQGRMSVSKLSDLECRSIDSFLSLLFLANVPGNWDTMLVLLLERRFRAFKTREVEFAEEERAEAEVFVG